MEFEVQSGAVKRGDILGQTIPGDLSKDWVVRSPGVSHSDLARRDREVSLSPDKIEVDLLRVALFKPHQLLGQYAVQGVWNDGH